MNSCFRRKTLRQVFRLISGHYVGAYPTWCLPQSSLNLGKSFLLMLAFEKIQMLQHAKAWKLKIFYHKTKQPFKVK